MNTAEELNERQKEAVLHSDGPILIVAGAGAGKTKTLTHRILNLIRKGIAPERILAVTFTNKAAGEMKERVKNMLFGEDKDAFFSAGWPFIGTFHSLGLLIIKENLEKTGLKSGFAIFDRNDSGRAVKEAMKKLGLDPQTFQPSKILSGISRRKSNMEKPEDIGRGKDGLLAVVWKEYENILRSENALDFDDILLKSANLLKYHPNVREKYADRWHYIHIDEYQDTNRIQYEMAVALAEKRKNICVVGDADQSIYSWRGADIRNIMDFEKDYPEAKIVLLEENYRSTGNILAVANSIIAKNRLRKEKKLFTRKGDGEKIGLFFAGDENEEADFVAERAKKLIENGVRAGSIAVLMRANFQNRVMEEYFMQKDVPYQIIGTKFFERAEVKAIIAYLKVAMGQKNAGDMKRVLSLPPKGLGKVALLKILSGKESELTSSSARNFAGLQIILREIKETAEKKSLAETLAFAIKKSGIEDYLKKESDGEERLLNLAELVSFSLRYSKLPPKEAVDAFIEDASLSSDQDELEEKKEAVRIMTVHAAKGLEFDYVFVSGLEDGLFPLEKKFEKDELSESEREEERRLFYVATTRAKKKLFLSMASTRNLFGARQVNAPSRFLTEIPDEYLEAEQRTGSSSGKVIYF